MAPRNRGDGEGPSKSEQKAIELQGMLADRSAELAGSEGFQHFKSILNLSRQRHSYSPTNLWLISLQDPTASLVMPFHEWKKVGRRVLSAENGGQPLYILKPHSRWATKENDKGQEERVKVLSGFGSTHTYDIKSTVGPDLPKPQLLDGKAPSDVWVGLVREVQKVGWQVEVVDSLGPMDGFARPADKTIRINGDRPALHQLHTLGHEFAHVKMGHVDDLTEYSQHRGQMEVEADSGSFVAMGLLGLDVSADSVYYVTQWAEGDGSKILAAADKAIKFGRETAEAIDPSLRRELPENEIAGQTMEQSLERPFDVEH